MKFFSFLTRTPSHRSFSYTPRYYDPLKERMEERLRGEQEDSTEKPRNRIKGSFRQGARIKERNTTSRNTPALMRTGITLALVLTLIAYLQWGTLALYGLLGILTPAYLYWKIKQS